jgi:hypothetical protein
MKNVSAFAAVVSLLAAACGGGGNAALSKNFNYGAPQAPSVTEQSAAGSAQDGIASAASFSTTPDATSASLVVSMASEVAASALGDSAVPVSFNAGSSLRRALTTAATIDTCTTVKGNTVTFDNCTSSESGVTVSLNGTVSGTQDSVTWSIHGSFSGIDNGISVNVNVDYSVSFKVTSATVKGNALVNVGGSMSDGVQTFGFGVSEAVLVDVGYQTTPSQCVTSGSIEVRRVWTQRPEGATSVDLPDAGVKLAWASCDAFTVAHSQ